MRPRRALRAGRLGADIANDSLGRDTSAGQDARRRGRGARHPRGAHGRVRDLAAGAPAGPGRAAGGRRSRLRGLRAEQDARLRGARPPPRDRAPARPARPPRRWPAQVEDYNRARATIARHPGAAPAAAAGGRRAGAATSWIPRRTWTASIRRTWACSCRSGRASWPARRPGSWSCWRARGSSWRAGARSCSGRSDIVGKPMALLLLHADATVTVCHSRTRDLAAVTREADVLVAAIGRAGLVRAEHVKPGAVVVDVGMNRVRGPGGGARPAGAGAAGRVRAEGLRARGRRARPVGGARWPAPSRPCPAGSGPLTIAMLMKNTVPRRPLAA